MILHIHSRNQLLSSHLFKSLIIMLKLKQKINFLEQILKHLNGRGYLIKNAIDFLRFQTGA